MSLGSGGGRSVCLWRCCLLSVPLGEQASGRRWDCSGLGHVARRCFGTKWYDDVPGARSTRDGDTGNEDNSSFARFFKLDKYAMFSFAMTSGLASDSDKFKIIITLRRAQKFGDTGPYKNFDFLYNPFCPRFFAILAKIECSHCGSAVVSLVGAIGRAGLRKEVGLLRPGPRGPKVLRHQMVR